MIVTVAMQVSYSATRRVLVDTTSGDKVYFEGWPYGEGEVLRSSSTRRRDSGKPYNLGSTPSTLDPSLGVTDRH